MTEHELCLPKQRNHVEAKPASRPGECKFCHKGTVKNNYCPSCNTWFPSRLAEISPEKLRKLAAARRKAEQDEYTPVHDGVFDVDCESVYGTPRRFSSAAEAIWS
jgi:hypothetical protein